MKDLNYTFSQEDNTNYSYPNEYKGPDKIKDQILKLVDLFGLNPINALSYIDNLPELPKGSEGWFAFPSIESIADKYLPKLTSFGEKYFKSVCFLHDKIKISRSFNNYRNDIFLSSNLRVSSRTRKSLEVITSRQAGDIIIIPAQLGNLYKGLSVNHAHQLFRDNEFGLNSFLVSSVLLTHPNRIFTWPELEIYCSGDEFNYPESINKFDYTTTFFYMGGSLGFGVSYTEESSKDYGVASGFII